MAVNPAILKAVAKLVMAAARDERIRQAILVACLIPFLIILLVLSSPFAIFFSVTGDGTNADSISIYQTMDFLKDRFEEKIKQEKEDDAVDEVHTVIMGSEDNTLIDNSADVLIAYSVRYNVTNKGAEQMAVLKDAQIKKLENVFWDMNQITSKIDTIKEKKTYTTTNEKGKKTIKTKTITKKIKTIYIDCLSAEEIGIAYHFDKTQQRVIQEMKKTGIGTFVISGANMITLSKDQIAEIKKQLPENLSLEREKIVNTALSIVGKVNYFWGGKSSTIGWDDRWGKLMTVTSKGSSTTGMKRTFGLDCSGYVTWVFINTGIPTSSINETIGQGTTKQWNLSSSIAESSVEPGDLAFLAIPGTRKVNHVGIVVGKDKKGSILVAHCASGANNVVVTTAESVGFMYYRRPAVLME